MYVVCDIGCICVCVIVFAYVVDMCCHLFMCVWCSCWGAFGCCVCVLYVRLLLYSCVVCVPGVFVLCAMCCVLCVCLLLFSCCQLSFLVFVAVVMCGCVVAYHLHACVNM